MKRIQDSNEYKIVKQITSKENKKSLRKATKDFLIFFTAIYISAFLFVKIAFWIWQN